jgi:hypothetical protein
VRAHPAAAGPRQQTASGSRACTLCVCVCAGDSSSTRGGSRIVCVGLGSVCSVFAGCSRWNQHLLQPAMNQHHPSCQHQPSEALHTERCQLTCG